MNGKELNDTLSASPSTLLMENSCKDRNICISIPLYFLRPVNFDVHFEYEIR